jgi:tetratricopeptide (TPR) repeat protein
MLVALLAPVAGAASGPDIPVAASDPQATFARGEAYAHLMRALFAVRRGEVARAVEEIHEALALAPDSPDMHTEAARLLLQWTGRIGEAERLARSALELDGEHEGATRFLAEVAAARALGPNSDEASRTEAIRLYEKLAEGDTTDHPDVLRTLFELHRQAGDLGGAVRAVRRLVKERPGDMRATQTLVQLLLQSGEPLESLRVLLEYAVGHPSQEDLFAWAEQLANSQRAWPTVVEFLEPQAPFSRGAPALNRFYGEALLHVGRLEPAAAALQEALAATPDDAKARQDLAWAYRGMGRLAEAAGIFRELTLESPDYPHLHQLLAETLLEQRDVEGALQSYRTALGILEGRNDVSASHRDAMRQKVAALHLSRGDHAEVEAALDELELPEGPVALEIRCRVAIETESWEAARRQARRLADAEETGLATLLEGEIAAGERKWARAASKFEEGIALEGHYARPRVAEVYRVAGKPEAGLVVLKSWIEAEPEVADAHFHLGVYYYELDRLDEAEPALREAFRIDPAHDRALNFLGYSLAERKIRLDEALEMIERALEVDAWNGAYLDSLGWVYYQMGRPEEALRPLERAAHELPKDSTVLEHLGDVYFSLGDREGAVTAWRRALAEGAEDPEALLTKIRRDGEPGNQLAADEGRASSDRSPR